MPPTLTKDTLQKKLEHYETELKDHQAAIIDLEEANKLNMQDLQRKLAQVQGRAFGRDPNYKGVFADEQESRGFALMVLARAGVEGAAGLLKRDFGNQAVERAMDSTADGGLLPTQYASRLQALFEVYGTFERNAFRLPMSGQSLVFPRQLTDPEVFLLSENVDTDESEPTFGNITLTAQEWGVLMRVPKSYAEDALPALGELIARSMVRAFAKKLDTVGFSGDGSKTSFGIVGVVNRLLGLDATIGNIAGLVVGTGNAWSELTLSDHEMVVGTAPSYVEADDPKWYVSRSYFFTVMVKLMLAAGGVTAAEIEGRRRPVFMGYEVELVNSGLPRAEANSQVCALFGSLRQAATIGDRQMLSIDTSDEALFVQRQRAYLGVRRLAVNVHDVGNASATAGERQAGPIVGLVTAAS